MKQPVGASAGMKGVFEGLAGLVTEIDALEVSDLEELAEEVDRMLIASSSFIHDEARPELGIGEVFGLFISCETPEGSDPDSVFP